MSAGGGLSVLVTRPPPGLDETMRALRAAGHRPIAAPLLRVRPLSPVLPARAQAILLTSGQAVVPLAAAIAATGTPHLLAVPLLAVGDRTAARAREAGFTAVHSAAGDANALLALTRACCHPAAGPLLLCCGAGQGASLCRTLRDARFRVIRRSVYATVPVRRLPEPARAALAPANRLDAALFFSRDTAAVFVRLLPRPLQPALARTRALAISQAAAEPLLMLSWRAVETPSTPMAETLLSLLEGREVRPVDRAGLTSHALPVP